MVVRVPLVVVDRNARMVLVLELDLVFGRGMVVRRILAQAVGVMVMMMVLAVVDLVVMVYRRNRLTHRHSPQAVNLRA
jgi:hypothetical protein